MKFVLSYSGGKDSILALHRMKEQGHIPVALLVMYREEAGRSWVHGMDPELLDEVADALGLPVLRYSAGADTYAADMERGLRRAKELGAEACVFGDIDLEAHRSWDEARCAAVGLEAVLPLWGMDRAEAVGAVLDLGYRCIIKCVRNDVLPGDFAGQVLTRELLEQMERRGADLCGENGEYHTVVVDGPVFRRPANVTLRGLVELEHNITAADLAAEYKRGGGNDEV